jgi:hypothetical protein
MAVLGNVEIFVRSRHGVDPYFHLSKSDPSISWQKECFFLRNDADVPLSVFTGSRPIRQPKWEYAVAQKDLPGYNPCVMSSSACYEEG